MQTQRSGVRMSVVIGVPGLDAIRTPESRQEVLLLVKLYRHRQKGVLVSLGKHYCIAVKSAGAELDLQTNWQLQ